MIAGRARAWAIRVIAEYRVEAALALLARRVEHRDPGAASLLCVRSEAVSASRASALLCPGIARLRGSAALVVASSCMIGASIDGYLASRERCRCHRNVVSEKGSAHRG